MAGSAELSLMGRSVEILFAAPEGLDVELDGADAVGARLDLAHPVKAISSVRTDVPLDDLRGCETLHDAAGVALRLSAPLAMGVHGGLFAQVACTAVSAEEGQRVCRVHAAALATRLHVTPLETPRDARLLHAGDLHLSITFYTTPRRLREARSEHAFALWQRLVTRAPGLSYDVFCGLVEPPIGATTLRAALGRCKRKAPLNCLLIASVERAILKQLARGGAALAATIESQMVALATPPTKKRARAPPLSDEANAFFTQRAAAWRGAGRKDRAALEAKALEDGRGLPGAERWTPLLVHNALKNRAAQRRPRE